MYSTLMLMSEYVFFPREIQKTTVFVLNSHNIIICYQLIQINMNV